MAGTAGPACTADMGSNSNIYISVVSHGQCALVANLLKDLDRYCPNVSLCVAVTLNIPEELCFDPASYSFTVEILRNAEARGFSANHNAAFNHMQQAGMCEYFCVVNPDIRLNACIFPRLLEVLSGTESVGVVAPMVRSPAGTLEDSARPFPRFYTPVLRALGIEGVAKGSRGPDQRQPDWVGGMFMLFSASVFKKIGGFDERYFLYYEDVDICARLQLAGYRVAFEPREMVIHAARRDSHRKLKYLRWHLRSALRFFASSVYRRVITRAASRIGGPDPR